MNKLIALPVVMLLIAAAPAPDPKALRASVDALVGFGTRHTLSSATDPKRGIGAARRWATARLAVTGKACGGCITIDLPTKNFSGARIPQGVEIVNVMGVQRGTVASNDVVIVAGHIDSRASDVMDAVSDAPGANDDASGVALVLEAARLLSKETHRATIIYAILSGEEQGLFGGRLLAETAKARGWNVIAMLNNDIVGNTVGTDGRIVADRVRLFSEGIRFSDDEAAQRTRRGNGGEDDGPSRALGKAVERIAKDAGGLTVLHVRRPDRFSRGGDHLPMLEAGYPAVRFSVGVENYDAQHQNVRAEGGRIFGDTADRMDFDYLAKVTALNVSVMRTLANAPPPPARVIAAGAVASDTTLSWDAVPGAAGYKIYWRSTANNNWTDSVTVGPVTTHKIDRLIIDDHFVGVAAVGADGAESLITFAEAAPR